MDTNNLVGQQLAKDAFWDSNSFAAGSHLDPAKYHSIAEETVLGGRSMADAVPTGRHGAFGTIVRRSTADGAPVGHNPDAVATQVLVDPDIPGQGFVFDPTKIRKEQLARAVATGMPQQGMSVEDRRFNASNILRQFAAGGMPDPQMPGIQAAARTAPVNLPNQYVVPAATEGGGQQPMQEFQKPTQTPQGIQIADVVGRQKLTGIEPQVGQTIPQQPAVISAPQPVKAASLDGWQQPQQMPPQSQQMPQQPIQPVQQQQQPVYPSVNVVQQQQAPTSLFDALLPQQQRLQEKHAEMPAKPPTFRVEFEIHGIPFKQEAYYHQIIRNDANLVLVFDRRAIGYPRNFPLATDADMAAHIEGQDVVYRVHTTGIQFPFLDYDLCILLIKSEHSLNQDTNEEAGQIQMPAAIQLTQ